ncbi:cytochrome D1 domain-containing protein [sulfur-oxidizing endosymbiont of Gigantopelta aegis]|uniref:cytochrome D1 domain-containing protein n=1 Tax=sulfur-oxidizing endosymbiont of Gigantopelta aegis TaxID=2794934 RepID=UPI0018DCD26D|nr:cytochrome D1 domain-containing protein [sulfur-oxidizing endosymbiont of Gigantopelta aegis]
MPDILPTGDLGVIIERMDGSVLIINNSSLSVLCRVEGLGDLSHASVVFSRDERYAFVFGRDGGLTKIDLLKGKISKRLMQSGNSIGGAISQDGQYIAVSNYEPGGVNIFAIDDLSLVAKIPAIYGDSGLASKTVGLVDAPNNEFIFSLYDGNEIWQLQMDKATNKPKTEIKKYHNIGKAPYDALISSNGRYYIAGLFGEDGLSLLDLWHPEKGIKRILNHYGKGQKKLPVYKMPHLEGWAIAGNHAFLPAVGLHEVLVVDINSWQEVARIKVHSQPVFAMASPDDRQIWVNFAFPDNNTLQVIDSESYKIIKQFQPGSGILHMEFTPRSEQVWVSVRDNDEVIVYDTQTLEEVKRIKAKKPSGIFFTSRAHRIGL